MNKLKFLIRLSAFTLIISMLGTTPSTGIEGGFTKDSYLKVVVPLLAHENDSLPYCSGVLIDDFIVATASHCVFAGGGKLRPEIWVAPAGSDLSLKPKLSRVNKIFYPANYRDLDTRVVQDADIAFLIIKSPMLNGAKIRIATMAEVKALYGQSLIVGGYGRNRPSGPAMATPSFVQQKVIDWTLSNYTYGTYVHIVATDTESPCPGDSGGPIFKELGNELLVIGVIAGSNGCESSLAREERLIGFIISAFTDLKNQATSLIEKPANPALNLRSEVSDNQVKVDWSEQSEQYLLTTRGYQVIDGQGKILCEANTLQIFKNDSSCSFTMPETAIAPFKFIPIGLKKNGEAFTLDLISAVNYYKKKADAEAVAKAQAEAVAKAQAEAVAKAQAEAVAKAQSEAVAKAQAEAVAKAQAEAVAKAKLDLTSKVQTKTQKSIVCVKGKLKKVIKGTNPKCPIGYKKT